MIYWINSCIIICDELIKWVIKLCNLSNTTPLCFLSYASKTPKNILFFKDRSIVDVFFLQRYNYDIMVTLTFQKNTKNYYEDTSHDHFCHKLFAECNILSGIFIPLTNSCDLPVFDQISLFFYRKNLKSPGFENFRLTGLHYITYF